MPRQQIIVIIVAISALIGLYQLPKVVVENDDELAFEESVEDNEVHSINIPDSVSEKLSMLRGLIKASTNQEKSLIFADSLARAFLVYDQIDSAIHYGEVAGSFANSPDELERVGNFYYTAYSLNSGGAVQSLVEKVQKYYSQLVVNGDRPDLEIRMAMTLVSSENPMTGILKLRELAEQYPDNLEGQYNLGVLSIQSGQYDRAIARFERVIEIDSSNIEGYFYLGVSHLEKGDAEKAQEYFDYVAVNGRDPAIIQLVEEYLNKIN